MFSSVFSQEKRLYFLDIDIEIKYKSLISYGLEVEEGCGLFFAPCVGYSSHPVWIILRTLCGLFFAPCVDYPSHPVMLSARGLVGRL